MVQHQTDVRRIMGTEEIVLTVIGEKRQLVWTCPMTAQE